jgi:hypothetical protein
MKSDICVESVIAPLLKKLMSLFRLQHWWVQLRSTNDAISLMIKLLSKERIVRMPITNSAYGTGDENNFCTEKSPLSPIFHYAIEKVGIKSKNFYWFLKEYVWRFNEGNYQMLLKQTKHWVKCSSH